MQKALDSVYLLGSVRELKKLKSSQRISTRLNNDAGRLTSKPEVILLPWLVGLPETETASGRHAQFKRRAQCRADRSPPAGIAVCIPGIFPSSARIHARVGIGFAPIRLPNRDRTEHTTFEDRVARALKRRASPHIASRCARP